MPKTPHVKHCSWCRLLEVTLDARALCPTCGGVLLDGAGPNVGTFAPMSSDEKHAVFSRMMSNNRASRAQ
jgi:hypothetical protein